MRCRNCGHQNPEENRFCGLCGNLLAPQQAAEPEYVVAKVPGGVEREATEARRQTAVEPEQVETRAEPALLEPVAPAPPRSDKWWVDESSTTVGGPSFLGLSSADSSDGGGYSYLFQEEEERSHKGLWVFLLVLLALGGVLYLTTVLTHSRPQQPAPQNTTNDQRSTPPSSAPTTTLATSDAPSQPTITTVNKQSKAADQNKPADQKEGFPERDGKSAAGKSDAKSDAAGAARRRGDNAGSRQQAAKSQPSDKASANDADEESASAANEEKPAKKTAAPQANPGSELVTSGERYLYGRGAPRSCNQAVSYFNAAAAKQNPQAFSHLGALYATGECVPMDRAVAYAWFRRAYAKEPNNHYFEQNLTMLWREMTPEERQRATGRQ